MWARKSFDIKEMKWLKRHWRLLFGTIGTLLVLVGLFFAYWWFYKLAPCRRIWDPQWCSSHSQQEYWREVQTAIHRGMWTYDDGFAVGMYGDKSWAEWIMTHVEPGTSMGCLGGDPCHSASAMRFITNQDVGDYEDEDEDDDADAWLDWWKKNKLKSQEEWITDGFRQHGVAIYVPQMPKQTIALLEFLGKSKTNESTYIAFSANVKIDNHTKYNAFRCLRDSGFEPVEFALSNRTVSAEVERGLLEYAKRQRIWPSASGVGILSFRNKDEYRAYCPLPALLMPKFQAAAYALIFAPLAVGAGLIAWSFRKSKKKHP